MKKKLLSIFIIWFLVLPIFAFSGGPYMSYDLANDGTYFAKAIYNDTPLKTQNEIANNIKVHKFELGANFILANDKTNGFDLSFRIKPHIVGFSFLENQNGFGVQYTYNNNEWAFIYPKSMFAYNIGIEIGPDFCWHFNNVSFGLYPYIGVSFEFGRIDFDVMYSTISNKSIQNNYVNFIDTFGIAPWVKVKAFMVSFPFGISYNSGNNTLTGKDINSKTISNSYVFTYIDAFFKIEIGLLF